MKSRQYLPMLFFAGILTIALLSFVWLGVYSRIIADDYCTAATGTQKDLFAATGEFYRMWSGNYTNFFVKSLLAPAQPGIHAFLTGGLILLCGVTLWLLLRTVCQWLNLRAPAWAALPVTLLLLYSTLDGSVSRQPLFWLGALIPYALPLALVLLTAWLIGRLVADKPSAGQYLFSFSLLAVLVFIIAGFSETYAAFQVTALTLLLIGILFYTSGQNRRRWGAAIGMLLGVALIGLLISATAPGNFVRQAALERTNLGVIPLVQTSVVFTTLLFIGELFGIAHFVFSMAAVLMFLFIWYPPAERAQLAALWLPRRIGVATGISAALAWLLVASTVAPPLYGAGEVASRTLFVARFTQLCLFVVWGYWLAVWLARRNFPGRLAHRLSVRLTRLALTALIIVMPTLTLIRHGGLAPNFSQYASAWDARHAQILEAKANGESEITVPALPYDMETYLELEKMQPRVNANWVNGCASNFYGVSVFVEEQPE